MDENELIQRCQQGELDCFNQLVVNYQACIYNLALRMLGNVQSAEDATQDTFILAWKAIRRFYGGNFRAWLMQICANSCRDQLRAMKRKPAISLEANLVTLTGTALSYQESPQEVAERRLLGEEVQKGIAMLPPDQRLAVILCDVQELSYEEIAKVMGTSIGTVRSRISRGRQNLRKYLSPKWELFGPEIRLNR